jgi:3-hydroxybutyryl-CoA dehydrogenase
MNAAQCLVLRLTLFTSSNMRIILLANEQLASEFTSTGVVESAEVVVLDSAAAIHQGSRFDAVIDLLYEDANSSDVLQDLSVPVIVSSVNSTLEELPGGFTRINGWPTSVGSKLVEAAAPQESRAVVEKIFQCFNKEVAWVDDQPGFISPRVISMIINEAFISLEQGVSTKEDINTAMKLGTNYPYGPFEWAEKIGLRKVHSLLQTLSQQKAAYTPARLLAEGLV